MGTENGEKPLTHAAQIFAIVLPFMLLFMNKWDRNNQKQYDQQLYQVKNKEKRKRKKNSRRDIAFGGFATNYIMKNNRKTKTNSNHRCSMTMMMVVIIASIQLEISLVEHTNNEKKEANNNICKNLLPGSSSKWNSHGNGSY